MDQTPGKGPFSRRATTRPKFDAPRWSAPTVDLDATNIQALLTFIRRQNDIGVYQFFKSLAVMEPQYRLARNLTELLRCMAIRRVVDVLNTGFSEMENTSLMSLEQWGVPIELLGVAHALLNVRSRRFLARQMDDAFFNASHDRRAKIDLELLSDMIEKRGNK